MKLFTVISSWMIHVVGLLLVSVGLLWAILLAAVVTPTSPITVGSYVRTVGHRSYQLFVLNNGAVEMHRAEQTGSMPEPSRSEQVFVNWGKGPPGIDGSWFSVYRWRTTARDTRPGFPAIQYTTIDMHWSFPAFVGIILATLPLALPPARRAILAPYRWVLSGGATLVRIILRRPPPINRRRGFEVVERQAPDSGGP